ncbi:hypothetical protein BKD03_05115 [Brucella sp. 09RB8471]|nr:hypothetical protein BKD03_05115 [Brucella sp. 09RB8471]
MRYRLERRGQSQWLLVLSQRRETMADQIQVNRRTILAGAALAGALGPVLSATSAWGRGQ